MTNQFVSIVEILTLNDILDEIKSIFSFKISNFTKTQDFLNKLNNKDLNISSSIIISNKNNSHLLLSKTIDPKNLILMDNTPIRIDSLIDKINILLIKKKYDFQSQFNIKNYIINLNSKIITKQSNSLKLTEREIDIILFLKEKGCPQSVNNLQNEVWNYSSILETHTVETHIYRLRKKFKDHFNDESFILSLKEGYKI
jgi:hypothetical protein